MSETSFVSSKKFFDTKNYPRGFSRSGDFTIKESAILENQGYALKDLAEGIRKAKTIEEKAFVEVIKGKAKATSIQEKTWIKYNSLINQTKRVYTLSEVTGINDLEDYD